MPPQHSSKRCIWLHCRFAQQAEKHQRCLHLYSLCRGASAYAVLVRGDYQPTPTPTNKTSDPKVLHHPFWDRGQPLPRRRWAGRTRRPRCHLGRRHRPHAPNSRGGALCMPLCFGAAQTAAAASENYVSGLVGQCFHPTSHPTKQPQLFSILTVPTMISSGNWGRSCYGPSMSWNGI